MGARGGVLLGTPLSCLTTVPHRLEGLLEGIGNRTKGRRGIVFRDAFPFDFVGVCESRQGFVSAPYRGLVVELANVERLKPL